jgi:hypothetical protein
MPSVRSRSMICVAWSYADAGDPSLALRIAE